MNSPATMPNAAVVSPSPIVPQSPKETSVPIMNTSPWAKLISSMMP